MLAEMQAYAQGLRGLGDRRGTTANGRRQVPVPALVQAPLNAPGHDDRNNPQPSTSRGPGRTTQSDREKQQEKEKTKKKKQNKRKEVEERSSDDGTLDSDLSSEVDTSRRGRKGGKGEKSRKGDKVKISGKQNKCEYSYVPLPKTFKCAC